MEVGFVSEPGEYYIEFHGGDNSFHGILDVEIDGTLIGDIDQYALNTVYPSVHKLRYRCTQSGTHVLVGTVARKRAESKGFWNCLFKIVFMPLES